MIIEVGGRRAAVTDDQPAAAYPSVRERTARQRAGVMSSPPDVVRATVEILRRQGGIAQRALVGGELRPDASGWLTLVVSVAGRPLGVGDPATCPSELGSPLVPGLPDDFAPAVLDGITDGRRGAASLPSGELRVDRAAYDEVGSSTSAFGLAAALLTHLLASALLGRSTEETVRATLRSW